MAARQTTHPNRRFRQQRALAQRGDEFGLWTSNDNRTETMMERCRNKTNAEDKANKASQDVTNLKKKLQGAAQ